MHEYDVTLKSLLLRLTGGVVTQLAGAPVERWHNVELPEVRNPRVDLLGETAAGQLIHIELQRDNDAGMIWRMAEYRLAIRRKFGRSPAQCVLYFGYEPMRMVNRIRDEAMTFECRMVDFREFDAEPLLASECLEENILAVLARLQDAREAVRRILGSILASDPGQRATALRALTILAGLRKLESVTREEIGKVSTLNDLMDHDLFGPVIRQGREEGREEGERLVVVRQMTELFGRLPGWAEERLEALSPKELEQISVRLLKPSSLDELLR